MPKFALDPPGGPPAIFGAHYDRHAIGALARRERKGGSCFVVLRRGDLRDKLIHCFPLTEDGWAAAWRELAALDRAAAGKLRQALEQRAARQRAEAELAELDASTVRCLRNVIYLGGYAPGADLQGGTAYDLRFLEDRLGVYPSRVARVLVDVPYSDVEAVDLGGPGLVKSGGGFVGGGFGVVGAVEGMAIAAVLNALTTQVKLKTVLRIQASECELFMLNSVAEPDALRIELSRPLGAIRAAQAAKASSAPRTAVARCPRSSPPALARCLPGGRRLQDQRLRVGQRPAG
jgi:hypothetical protein